MFCFRLIGRGTPERPRVVLVFFLGGVTYAEISSLRFMSQREEGILVANYYGTTLIIQTSLTLGACVIELH